VKAGIETTAREQGELRQHVEVQHHEQVAARAEQIMSRRTDGEAVLPLPAIRGIVILEIHLVGSMTYAVDAAPEDRAERRAAA
jgi:hypothetical protein